MIAKYLWYRMHSDRRSRVLQEHAQHGAMLKRQLGERGLHCVTFARLHQCIHVRQLDQTAPVGVVLSRFALTQLVSQNLDRFAATTDASSQRRRRQRVRMRTYRQFAIATRMSDEATTFFAQNSMASGANTSYSLPTVPIRLLNMSLMFSSLYGRKCM